jgi:hypothetical protein
LAELTVAQHGAEKDGALVNMAGRPDPKGSGRR